MFEVKYRGVAAVNNFRPTQALPRPGAAEAALCLKQISQREKVSQLVVLSVGTEEGIRCFDTTVNPPRMVFTCSVYEIAHCGQHPANPIYFSIIIGSRDRPDLFLCHAFKCQSKEASMKITRAVAGACTQAYEAIRERRASQSTGTGGRPPLRRDGSVARGSAQPSSQPGSQQGSQTQLRLPEQQQSIRRPTTPKFSDVWFKPTISREEVPQVLKGADIGCFVVRQSQSQPGDYAISVQTGGQQLWTGLIISTDRGYQLGQKGGRQFQDLLDLIGFYSLTPFMKDAFDRPLTLRLPDQKPMSPSGALPLGVSTSSNGSVSPSGATPGGDDEGGRFVRKPTFKNPPLDFTSHKAAAKALESLSATPACGWPESTDEEEEEDDAAFTPKSKAKQNSMSPIDADTEREMFEKFMNAQIGKDGLPVSLDIDDYEDDEEEEEEEDDDDILERLRIASMSQNSPPKASSVGGPPRSSNGGSEIGFDDEFVPPPLSNQGSRQSLPPVLASQHASLPPPSASAMRQQVSAPPPSQQLQLDAPEDVPPLLPLTQYIFESLPRDADECITGNDVRPVLMRSGLSVAVLGQIWMEVDTARRGKIDFEQLGLVLGLISQAQRGQTILLEDLDADTVPAPRMEGLTPDKCNMY